MADWAFKIRQIGRYPVTKMTRRRPLRRRQIRCH